MSTDKFYTLSLSSLFILSLACISSISCSFCIDKSWISVNSRCFSIFQFPDSCENIDCSPFTYSIAVACRFSSFCIYFLNAFWLLNALSNSDCLAFKCLPASSNFAWRIWSLESACRLYELLSSALDLSCLLSAISFANCWSFSWSFNYSSLLSLATSW